MFELIEGHYRQTSPLQLQETSSVDLPRRMAQHPWSDSQHRTLLALAVFELHGQKPDLRDLCELTRLGRAATSQALGVLKRSPGSNGAWTGHGPWVLARAEDRVAARRNGRTGGWRGRRRQLYELQPWLPGDSPMVILPARAAQLRLTGWSRRLLTVLGAWIREDEGEVRDAIVPAAEVHRSMHAVAGATPTPKAFRKAVEELQRTGLLGCHEAALGSIHGEREPRPCYRVELLHPPLQVERTTSRRPTATADTAERAPRAP